MNDNLKKCNFTSKLLPASLGLADNLYRVFFFKRQFVFTENLSCVLYSALADLKNVITFLDCFLSCHKSITN